MSYITINYNQLDATVLALEFTFMQSHFKEITSKKCMAMIQGLSSRSFELFDAPQVDTIQRLFRNLPVWIKTGLKSDEKPGIQTDIIDKSGNLREISLGYQKSIKDYFWNKRICNYNLLKWKTDVRQKYLAIQCENYEMRFNQDCLEKHFIILADVNGNHTIILPLKASPRCYVIPRRKGQFYERILDFLTIDASCLANSSTACLQFCNQNTLIDCVEFLVNVIKLDCHRGNINYVEMPTQTQYFDHILSDFWSSYAYQMLQGLGYRIKRRITLNTQRKIIILSIASKGLPYANHLCYLKLIALYYRARYNKFFDINKEFDNIEPIPSSVILSKWEYVPRIYLTPYGIFPLAIKPMRGNRILREKQLLGPSENFCRVLIRDVDLGLPQNDFMRINELWIKTLIIGNDNIKVGDRQFHFLLCSNSQLRDRSFWFYSSYKNLQAEHIRQWMGDFSSETCVGTRIARMALSLTGTTATIKLLPHQMERIEDKFDGYRRNFTDGVGKISPKALKQALLEYNPELIEDNYMPCVIQARLNGIKGVFAIAPDLNDRGILIQYRPSQYKFKTNHNVLEIVKHGGSGMAFLNRQVIVLLENMGIKEHIFLKLQNKARKKISMSLLSNKSAQRTLEQNVRSFDWDRMRQSGVQLIREPFARSLLLLLAQERLKRLKERSHVQIPLSDGRMLIGIVDETNSLKYGQVFIQLRDLDGRSQIICDRKILITKNPAHFPGDIRKLDAVDCPALHHLFECVVFPAQGQRPHPNEISGSDLDGDEYWVCWNEDLVNNATIQHSPATFDSAGKTKHDGDITMNVIADFLFKYLSSDSLGALSNRHLACCALNSPSHPNSLRLADIISQAVDFPKTGVLPKNPKDIRIDDYPDYMENKYKNSYESQSSIGTMYRQIKEIWEMHSIYRKDLEVSIDIDQDFLINGYVRFIDEAKKDYQYYASRMDTILSIYNLESEYELITGCHSCPEEEKKNSDSVETASLEFRHLMKVMRDRFSEDDLSYKQRLRKASAWYYVAYSAGTTLSFAWIMDRLMSDIIKRRQLPQEEHQALNHIGKAIRHHGFEALIKEIVSIFKITNEDCENMGEMEILGCNFLEIIKRYNDIESGQDSAHILLRLLHRIALNIL